MIEYKRVSPRCADAQILIEELNTVLQGIVDNSGTKHVCLDDFEREGAFFLVGYREGVPVCCAGVRQMDEVRGEIKRVYARPNREGIGAQLLAELERQAAQMGYRELLLECREINRHALQFYARQGYAVCENYDPYNGVADAVCMKKELPAEDEENEKMKRIIDNMIAWAQNALGNERYAGWCLSFIEDALEQSNDIEIFGGDSAKESAEMYADAMRTGKPERGAFVFYDCLCESDEGPVNWGHCGICLGNGQVIHAWNRVRVDDYREIERLTSLTGDHPAYIGWVPVSRVLEQKP